VSAQDGGESGGKECLAGTFLYIFPVSFFSSTRSGTRNVANSRSGALDVDGWLAGWKTGCWRFQWPLLGSGTPEAIHSAIYGQHAAINSRNAASVALNFSPNAGQGCTKCYILRPAERSACVINCVICLLIPGAHVPLSSTSWSLRTPQSFLGKIGQQK